VLRLTALTQQQATAISTWRYAGRWSVYDGIPPGPDPASGYLAVMDDARDPDDQWIGFACTGAEARVPGQYAVPGVIDIGFGMRPDLVGQGLGPSFVAAILDHVGKVADESQARELRVIVQAWNERSRRVVERAGFVASGDLVVRQSGREVPYVELRRLSLDSA
jgi:[ribosomal protein S18]-alanine N-acetyltransferase